MRFPARSVLPLLATFALAAGALGAGCGKKGPLYLRDSPPPGVRPAKPAPYEPVPYPPEPAEEEEKK